MKVTLDGMVNFNQSGFIINEAGNDFQPSVVSESPVFIAVNSGNEWDKWNNPNSKWRLEIQRTDFNWNSDLVIEVVRSGEGINLDRRNKDPKIFDGKNYQPVNQATNYFFRGRGEIVEIPIIFKLSGFSVVHGAQDFETNIIFTVYDDW